MFYIGVDIAKNNHEASIIDSNGKLVSESFSFSNSIRGLEKFQKFISSFSIDSNNCIIGMEATGHYWLSLYSFLIDLDFYCVVINPIQSDAFRKMYIRQTKNDSVDSFVIAQILRFGEFSVSHFLMRILLLLEIFLGLGLLLLMKLLIGRESLLLF